MTVEGDFCLLPRRDVLVPWRVVTLCYICPQDPRDLNIYLHLAKKSMVNVRVNIQASHGSYGSLANFPIFPVDGLISLELPVQLGFGLKPQQVFGQRRLLSLDIQAKV